MEPKAVAVAAIERAIDSFRNKNESAVLTLKKIDDAMSAIRDLCRMAVANLLEGDPRPAANKPLADLLYWNGILCVVRSYLEQAILEEEA